MVKLLRKIADSKKFQNFITLIIIFAGIVVGMQTYPELVKRIGHTLHFLDQVVLWIFVVEIIIKMGAEGKRPWRYFFDPWNIFDFLIVAACFLPVGAQYAMVLRLARLLRVLKLVRALPKLQILVSALLKSIPSMAYISLLLLILFYLYAVTATFMFSANDPVHFKNLQTSMLSLFRAVTLEDWTDLMYIQMMGCDKYGYAGIEHLCTAPAAKPLSTAIFFVTFVLLGTMIILNLFIGVIMNGMEEARREAEDVAMEARKERGEQVPTLEEKLQEKIYECSKKLLDLQDSLGQVERELKTEIANTGRNKSGKAT
jgi:voltage-gated sodium channel